MAHPEQVIDTQPWRAETPGGPIRVPPRLWLLVVAGCLVAGVLDAAQFAARGLLLEDGRVDVPGMIWQGSEWLFLAALTPLAFVLGQRYPLRRQGLGRALGVHVLGALVLCVGWATLGVILRRALGRGWVDSFAEELGGWMLFSLPWSFFMYFALVGVVHAFRYWVEARDRELHAVRLSGQLAESRLRALRAQLHPHFLFNALNAITVLVRDARMDAASGMLERLSELLRQLLRIDPEQAIALERELHLVREYLSIEQVRFADRLQAVFAVDEDVLAAPVPSFILQPLIENAVRHGVGASTEPVRIEVGARRDGDELVLWVEDSGPGLGAVITEGVGLENTRERLRAHYGAAARLSLVPVPGGGTRAEIRLPFASRK